MLFDSRVSTTSCLLVDAFVVPNFSNGYSPWTPSRVKESRRIHQSVSIRFALWL